MFRLVNAGYAPPGLTGWGILNATALDVLLDYAYGLLIERSDAKQRRQLDATLRAMDTGRTPSGSKIVEVTKRDGTVVRLTEARLEEIRSKITRIDRMGRR